jgi:hypothetical protein
VRSSATDEDAIRTRAREIFDIYLLDNSPYKITGLSGCAKAIREIKRCLDNGTRV